MAETKENPVSINNLPYEILHKIISLIPFKEAARTIILSSSWKDLWAPIRVFLNTNSNQTRSQESGQQMNQIISSFFNTYKNSHQSLNIHLNKETLFLKAIKGVEKELHISFHGENPKVFGLYIELVPFCENNHFRSLKTLHLRSITSLAGSVLSAMFSGCQNLETLILEKCIGMQDIDLKAHNLLQKFVVLDCQNLETVSISSSPKLKSFLYQGTLVKILVKDTSNLFDVTLNLKGTLGDYGEFESEDLVPLLASLMDVEVLVLSGWLLEYLCTTGVLFNNPQLKFNKVKELSWIDCTMNKHKRDSLACFLTFTPSLEKLFIKIDKEWNTTPSLHIPQSSPQLWTKFIAENWNDSQLEHLNMVKFFGFKIEEENQILVSFMDILLKKAIFIRKMSVIALENNLSWHVAKVPQSHLKKIASSTTRNRYFSKSSILLSSLKNECGFLLTLEDDSEKISRFL